MIRCPGCGGRNSPDALICEWCHLPFVRGQQRGLSTRWWATLSAAIVVVLLILVAGLAGVNALRSAPRQTAASATPSPERLLPLTVSSPSPAALASPTTPPALPAGPAALPTPIPAPGLAAPAKSGPTARIANTGGLGANLRAEPGGNGAVITTIQEGATVRLLGPEQRAADGRLWRQVQDADGRQGWVLGDVVVE
jgi:uncharacterized protein YgiM (DUF1202 family)